MTDEETGTGGGRAPERLRETALSWLAAIGWKVEERGAEGAAWVLVADDGVGHRLNVGQDARKPELVLISGAVALGAEHATKLEAVPSAAREELLWDLRFELLRIGVDFQIQGPGLKGVAVRRLLFWDEDMTRSRFLEAAKQVQRAVIATIWHIRRRLDEPGGEVPESGFGPH